VAFLAAPYFSILPHKWKDFRKKNVLSIKCVFLSSGKPVSEKVLILRGIQRDIVINVKTFSCEVPVILARF
jgi:hypothetical protein